MPDVTLWDSIGTAETLGVVAIAAAGGALGGLANHLAADPRPTSAPADPGRVWKSMVVGLVAAVAALYALDPTTGVKLIAMAVVAGYAGKALLGALEARLKLAAALEETRAAVADRAEAIDVATDALTVARRAKPELAAGPRAAMTTSSDAGASDAGPGDLDILAGRLHALRKKGTRPPT